MNIVVSSLRRTAGYAGLMMALMSAVPAWAQDRLSIGLYEVVSSGPGFGATIGLNRALAGQLAAGGRYGLLYDRLIDRVTGAEFDSTTLGLSMIATDAARPRAFFAHWPTNSTIPDAIVMADLQTGAITPLMALTGTGPLVTARFAVDTQRLVVSYSGPTGLLSEWAVVEVSGATPVVRTVAVPFVPALPAPIWTISPDGTRLYRADTDFASGTSAVVAFDLATGAETGRVPMPTVTPNLEWSAGLDAVIDIRQASSNAVFTAFSRDLQPIGTATMPATFGCGVQAVVSPATGRAYVLSGGGTYFGQALEAQLTGALLGTPGPIEVSGLDPAVRGNCGPLHLASPPGAPRRLTASVGAGAVSFAWENVGGASQFTVDVGVAPGRTDLSIPLGPDSKWTIANVPPGTYYARVRGANTFGGGRPSSEVAVVVP